MTVSEKQLEANIKNAQKGGVKTPEGKEIVKYNALKHGLLAKEVVITIGDGAENPEEFNTLLGDLMLQLQPEGTLEEMLVEKIAVAYWRLRRAYRYEVGLIRNKLDDATDDYYENTDYEGHKFNKTDEEIEQDIKQEQENLEGWEKDKEQLTAMRKDGKSLDEIYDWEGNWDWLTDKVSHILPEMDEETTLEPKEMRKLLNTQAKWSDDQIWQVHIELCDDRIKHHREQILSFEKQKVKNKLRIQVIKKLGSIPSKDELDRLLRYEGAIERQLYKAINQLERQQRLRAGDNVPAPIAVDVDVNTAQNN
jgi:predicted  nucleic acid-binding Zn-ribbon protein